MGIVNTAGRKGIATELTSMSFPTLSWTEAGMSPGSKSSSSICTVIVMQSGGESVDVRSDDEQRKSVLGEM